MLKTFLEKAANDQSVYITDVREAFQASMSPSTTGLSGPLTCVCPRR